MWTDEKQQLLDTLREKQQLTESEKLLLDSLFSEIEAEEEQLLRPAAERSERRISELQKECDEKDVRNNALAALTIKQQELLVQARTYLNNLMSEQAVINAERERLLGKTVSVG
ncbi:MAG: hypothetical protein ACKVZH_21515 [Blastocatellia bacterium]